MPIEPITKLRGAPGTFDRLTQDYFASPEFLALAESSRRTYRFVIERMIEEENIGHRLVREMTREHVRRILSRHAATPGAANSALQKLKVLLRFAIDNGWRRDDPTLRMKKFASDVVGMAWSDVEDGAIQVKPVKTRRSTGAKLTIPIHPELARALCESPSCLSSPSVAALTQLFADGPSGRRLPVFLGRRSSRAQ